MKAIRTWSEISYGLSETKRGASPKTRRFYKSRLNKVRRQMDKEEIGLGIPQPPPAPARQWGEWTFIDDPSCKDQEVAYLWAEWETQDGNIHWCQKEAEIALAWFIHTL